MNRHTGTITLPKDMPAPSPHDTQHIEHFVVDNLHCPSCIREIESTLYKIPDIEKARVNLSTHRLTVEWKPDNLAAADNDLIIQNLDSLGFKASLFRPDELLREQDVATLLIKTEKTAPETGDTI